MRRGRVSRMVLRSPSAWEKPVLALDMFVKSGTNDHPMSKITSLTSQQLRQAAELKDKIDALQKQLGHLLDASASAAAVAAPKRKMSPAAIAKIRAAAKARWARVRSANAAVKPAVRAAVVAKPAGKSSKMSPAAKAKLSAKMKAVWAARKAAKK